MISNILKSSFLLLLAIGLAACTTQPRQGTGLSYQLEPSASARYPAVAFDAESAKAALQSGSSTVKGRVQYYYDNGLYWDSNIRVSIYPATPHLEAWYQMSQSFPQEDVRVSPEAAKLRWDTRTDAEGAYVFTEMRPGKYFVQVEYYFNQKKVRDVYTGSGYTNYGDRIDYYRPEYYAQERGGIFERFVEITEDGQTVTANLNNKPLLYW